MRTQLHNIAKEMETTDYPRGYKEGFPEPMIDVDDIIARYRQKLNQQLEYGIESIILLKEYGLKKSIANTEYTLSIAETDSKKEWLNKKLSMYKAELERFNKKYRNDGTALAV